jgi:hypothetical protein
MKEPNKLFSSIFKKGLYSKLTLYTLLIVFLGDLFYLFLTDNTKYIVLYFLIGFITSVYSKNFVVIFFISIVAINILKVAELNESFHNYTLTLNNRHLNGIEGLENNTNNGNDINNNENSQEITSNNILQPSTTANVEPQPNPNIAINNTTNNTIDTPYYDVIETKQEFKENAIVPDSAEINHLPIPIVANSNIENFTTPSPNNAKISLKKINNKKKQQPITENFQSFSFVSNFGFNAGKWSEPLFQNFTEYFTPSRI